MTSPYWCHPSSLCLYWMRFNWKYQRCRKTSKRQSYSLWRNRGNCSLEGVVRLCCPSHIAKFMGPTWGLHGSCRTQMGPMWAPWTLLSGLSCLYENLLVACFCRHNHFAHDDVIKWNHFPRYWPFVWSPVNSPRKGQWRGALICVWINGWENNPEAGDLRRDSAHYDVTVMWFSNINVEYTNILNNDILDIYSSCLLNFYPFCKATQRRTHGVSQATWDCLNLDCPHRCTIHR